MCPLQVRHTATAARRETKHPSVGATITSSHERRRAAAIPREAPYCSLLRAQHPLAQALRCVRCCFPKCVCVCVHLLFGTASCVTVNTHHREGESSKERVPRTKTLEKYALFGSAPSRGPNGMRAKKRRQGGSKSTGEAPSRDRPASLTATAACGCVCVCVCVSKRRGVW